MKHVEHGYHTQTVTQVLRGLETSTVGLTPEIAKARLHEYGDNRLPDSQATQSWSEHLQRLSKPLIFMFIATALLSFWIGFSLIGYLIIALGLISIGYTLLINYKAPHRTAFSAVMPKMVRVRRDEVDKTVHAHTLVIGDIVELTEGQRIPADVRILETNHLWIDASEVNSKHDQYQATVEPSSSKTNDLHHRNIGLQGALVAKGSGLGIVIATGEHTLLGRAAAGTRAALPAAQPSQLILNVLSRRSVILILVTIVVVATVASLTGAPLRDIAWFAVAATLALAPFAFPILAGEVFGYAFLKFDRLGARLRRFGAVDTLGATEILLADAEHVFADETLTPISFMVAKETYQLQHGAQPTIHHKSNALGDDEINNLKLLFVAGLFASNAPTREHAPTYHDAALRAFSEYGNLRSTDLDVTSPALQTFPYDTERGIQTVVKRYNHDNNNRLYSFSAGSATQLLEHTTKLWLGGHVRKLTAADKRHISEQIEHAAIAGKETIGLAYRVFPDATDPANLTAEAAESSLIWLGLVTLEHRLREDINLSLEEAHEDHVAVSVFATNRSTRQMVTHLSGLHPTGSDVISINESECTQLSDKKLAALVKRGGIVFNHLSGAQKSRIVRAAQVAGHTVTLTGSSLEDAPAVMQAHTGIALGTGRIGLIGDIALEQTGLGTIMVLVERARVFAIKLRLAAFTLIAANLAKLIVVLASTVLLFVYDIPVAIALVHLVVLGLFFELFPAIAVSLDKPDTAHRKPHHLKIPATLIDRPALVDAAWAGLLAGGLAITNYLYYLERHNVPGNLIPADTPIHWKAMTIVLATLTLCHLANIFIQRSPRGLLSGHQMHNVLLWITSAFVVFLLWVAVYAPVFADYFKTMPLTFQDWVFVGLAVLVYILLREFQRYDRQHHRKHVVALRESLQRRH